jgi:hypothetical protein
MTAHTPGPWGVSAELHNRDERFILSDGEGGPVIAAVWPMGEDFDGTDDGTREANARLVAAAPELFEALRATSDDLADLSGLLADRHAVVLNTIRDRIDAALAKVTP